MKRSRVSSYFWTFLPCFPKIDRNLHIVRYADVFFYARIFRLTRCSFDKRALFKCCTNGSSFFTALNDGLTSALIFFLRTLLFQAGVILLLPLLWGINGIWLSVVAAEVISVLVTVLFILLKKNKYGYL